MLVEGLSVRYMTVEPSIYSSEDMRFGPSLVSILPKLPSGNYTDGVVAKSPYHAPVSVARFPGVQNT